jgi:hypothetical protein
LPGERRKRAITALEVENPGLWRSYVVDCQKIEAANTFFREGGRFPLTAVGKLNTYPLFAETFAQLVSRDGRDRGSSCRPASPPTTAPRLFLRR